MMWVIRGTDGRAGGGDFAMVVETRSFAAAEAWALKRGVPVVFIGQADDDDIAEAKRTKQLWKYTPEPHYTCFGRPMLGRHLACLMIVGVLTAGFVFVRTSKHLPHLKLGPTASRVVPNRAGTAVPKQVVGEFDPYGASALAAPSGAFIS